MANYKQRIEAIKSRINPDRLDFEKAFLLELNAIEYSDVKRYVQFAMKGVDQEYTNRCIDAGNRVKDHLKKKLEKVTYEYQGSVMTNTHIVATSDIDLLVISDLFFGWDRSMLGVLTNLQQRQRLNPTQIKRIENVRDASPYQGDSNQDLMSNRLKAEKVLTAVYEDYDTSKPRAIRITNKSLKKEVDVVIAAWYDNLPSIISGREKDYRGVQVFDKKTQKRGVATYPFLGIKRINERSTETNGRLKKMIRFLKNVKASINEGFKDDEQPVKFSSFQFNAMCYAIEVNKYVSKNAYELVGVIYNQLHRLYTDFHYCSQLTSVDGNEKIDLSSSESRQELLLIMNEVQKIKSDLEKESIA